VAEPLRDDVLRMGHGFLEDAPVLPRTFRFLVNVPGGDPIAVLAVNKDVFARPLDCLESKILPHTITKLNIRTVEIGVPEPEDWDTVLRLRKNLKASDDKPLVLFMVLSNGMNATLLSFLYRSTISSECACTGAVRCLSAFSLNEPAGLQTGKWSGAQEGAR